MKKLLFVILITNVLSAQNNAAFWLADEQVANLPVSTNGLVAYYNASIKKL